MWPVGLWAGFPGCGIVQEEVNNYRLKAGIFLPIPE